jgi:hypothetical protein
VLRGAAVENLAPLRRFLRSRVGRPWNDVHHEICALLNVRSAVQKHVLDHIREMVEVNVVMVDGVPHHKPGHWYGGSPIVRNRWREFYVCPLTGALRFAGLRYKRAPIDPRPGFAPRLADQLRLRLRLRLPPSSSHRSRHGPSAFHCRLGGCPST